MADDSADGQHIATESSPLEIVQLLLSGRYSYLTYMLISITSFIFWLIPNAGYIKKIIFGVPAAMHGTKYRGQGRIIR